LFIALIVILTIFPEDLKGRNEKDMWAKYWWNEGYGMI